MPLCLPLRTARLTLRDFQANDVDAIDAYATHGRPIWVSSFRKTCGLNRIFSTCDVANGASARVLEKASLQREATLQQHKYARGQRWTSFLYAIRREQWSP
jgi:hypothetical protein